MKDDSFKPLQKLEATKGKVLRFVIESVWVVACALTMAGALIVHRGWPPDWVSAGGLAILSLAVIVLTRFHIRHTPLYGIPVTTAERIIWVGCLAAIFGVQVITLTLGPRELIGVGFVMAAPLIAQAMLVSALIGPAISMFALTTVSLVLGISAALPIDTIVAGWLAGAVGAHAVNPLKQRSDLIRAMAVVGAASVIIAASAAAMNTATFRPVLESASWACLGAIVATSVFWFGVLVLEKGFGLTSDWSLLELCSPDHPLLRDLTIQAPGTYAHSVMVGNLAESAARDIGANAVLCRAMAYFHDIGKTMRPSYFVENQMGENLHDELPPAVSAKIINEHVKDGLELARKHRLPKIIRDGIQQHHGTSLISFFYGKALRTQEPTEELETSYRYDGPKPQTRETAILHLADCVEAVSRVFPRGSSEELEITVRRVIEERRADGQLDECDLTFRDLQTIEVAFLRALGALRHKRIEYPDGLAPANYDLEQLRTSYPDEHPPHGH